MHTQDSAWQPKRSGQIAEEASIVLREDLAGPGERTTRPWSAVLQRKTAQGHQVMVTMHARDPLIAKYGQGFPRLRMVADEVAKVNGPENRATPHVREDGL